MSTDLERLDAIENFKACTKITLPGKKATANTMRSTALFMLCCFFCGGVFADAGKEIIFLGNFSNIVATIEEPHPVGYAVDLYRRDDGFVFGEFVFADGWVTGTRGQLQNLRISGSKIRFETRMSSASYPGGLPTKELFVFSGKISKIAVTGTLTQWDGYELSRSVKKSQVRLKKSRQTGFPLDTYEQYLEIAPPGW